ncbi:hypothetical protein BKA70DRAFT_718235 [Coprinopsis sp. MPI-PUGE-AT-0042]|nr:hypothetical protein BKA70DRAFT_718235 [Coprinopsis sp. MPI-PUGE-AT-0042]
MSAAHDQDQLSRLAHSLIDMGPFSTEDVIKADDAVVLGLFGRVRGLGHDQIPTTLSLSVDTSPALLNALYETFERNKGAIQSPVAATAMEASYTAVAQLKANVADEDILAEQLVQSLAAYALLIGNHPLSRIRLKKVKPGPTPQRFGFSIVAKTNIPEGTELWELIGMIPKDRATDQATVSSIKATGSQDQPAGGTRLLYGPLRLANRRCCTSNTELESVEGKPGFIAFTTWAIPEGQEITVNLGSNWFPNGTCPCEDCHPDPVSQPAVSGGDASSSHREATRQIMENRASLVKNARKRKAPTDEELRESKEQTRENKRIRQRRKEERRRKQKVEAALLSSGSTHN